MARVSPQATAFAHRENEAVVYMATFAPSSVTEEEARQIRQAAWQPLALMSSGAYVNFVSEVSEKSVTDSYPEETYTRLARIKASYDPDNVFAQNHNILPAERRLRHYGK